MKNTGKSLIALVVSFLAATSVFGQTTTQAPVAASGESSAKVETPKDKDLNVKVYGFVKADYHYADGAILTFGNENQQAPNAAKRVTQFDDTESRSQLNMHNSRLGVTMSDNDRVKGKIEFDFQGSFGSSQSNTASGVVRLRQAIVDYKAAEGLNIFAGQMWDIFSPQGPLANYNYVAWQLGAGNVGMMTERAGVSYEIADGMNLKFALGNTSLNTGAEPTVKQELDSRPVYTALLTMAPASGVKVYLSGIYADVVRSHNYIDQNTRAGDPLVWDPRDYNTELNDIIDAWNNGDAMPASQNDGYPYVFNADGGRKIRKPSSGISLGASIKATDMISFDFETYYGENLGDLRTIALGTAQKRTHNDILQDTIVGRIDTSTASVDLKRYINLPYTKYVSIKEAGGWATIKAQLDPKLSVAMFAGLAEVLNKDDLASPQATNGSYTKIEALTKSIAYSKQTSSTVGNTAKNQTLGFNIGYAAHKNLTFYVQVQNFETTYYDGDRITKWRHIRSINATTGEITLVDATDYIDDMQIPDTTARATDITVGTMLKF